MSKGKGKLNLVVEFRGRVVPGEEGKAMLAKMTEAFHTNRESRLLRTRIHRIERVAPERRSVERAMLAVEERLVKAMWVLQRSAGSVAPSGGGCGWPPYLEEAADRYAEAVRSGGWVTPAPRPALPTSRDIDAATEAQGWLQWLSPMEARVLVLGAMTKRGDAGARINWRRVRSRLPELDHRSDRWLRITYRNALQHIVAELTQARSNALD